MRARIRWWGFVVGMLWAMRAVCAASETDATDRVDRTDVTIGLLLPPEETEAASLRAGASLGVELANQSSGPHFRLIIRGRAGQWGADGVEAARMATDDDALGLITPLDGAASHLTLQVAGRTGVPVVSLCPDSSVTETGVRWMVRIVPRTVEEATALFTGLPGKNWVAIVPTGRAGREAARDLRLAATSCQATLSQVIEFERDATNLPALARQILRAQPSGVLLWLAPAQAGAFAQSLRNVGFTGLLAGPGRLRSAPFNQAAGSASDGFIVAAPAPDPDAIRVRNAFDGAYLAHYGHPPDATAEAAGDASALLIAVLKAAGNTPARELFPLTQPQTGNSGRLEFDSLGNRKVTLRLFQQRVGSYIPLTKQPNP